MIKKYTLIFALTLSATVVFAQDIAAEKAAELTNEMAQVLSLSEEDKAKALYHFMDEIILVKEEFNYPADENFKVLIRMSASLLIKYFLGSEARTDKIFEAIEHESFASFEDFGDKIREIALRL